MMAGEVNDRWGPIVPLTALSPAHAEHEFDCVVDTGFTGFLVLPSKWIGLLGHRRLHQEEARLADGKPKWFDFYKVTVIWDGRLMPVEALAGGKEALLGMGLLNGYELSMQGRIGGAVRISKM